MYQAVSTVHENSTADILSSFRPSTACGPAGVKTVTLTQTVPSSPNTIAVALKNPSQITASISRAVSIDSVHIKDQSELFPTVEGVFTTTNALTYTLIVPVVEATRTSKPVNETGTDVYYVSVGTNTTDWLTNYTPAQSMTLGTTTVTLSPVPSQTGNVSKTLDSNQPSTRTIYRTSTSTVRGATPLKTGGILTGPSIKLSLGWNATTFSTHAHASGGSSDSPTVLPFSENTTVTQSNLVATATATINGTAAAPANTTISPATAYPDSYGYGYGYHGSSVHGYGKRQTSTCQYVTATINGNVVSWCNNYFGESTSKSFRDPPTSCAFPSWTDQWTFIQVRLLLPRSQSQNPQPL